MKIFNKGNWKGEGVKSCPICKTKDQGPVVLVAIDGTEDGWNVEAVQVHVKCINLRITTYNELMDKSIIYQKVGGE